MTEETGALDLDLSRRRLLAAVGLAGGAAVAGSSMKPGAAKAAVQSTPSAGTPTVAGLHLQFGADASSQVVVPGTRCSRSTIHV